MNASAISTAILLACLSEFESGNDDRKVGRAGEISRYQIKPEVWRDFSNCRVSWATHRYAFEVATAIMKKRVDTFGLEQGRQPTIREWYVLWNAPAQAYRGKPSKVVAKRAQRFENLVEASTKKTQ